MNIEILKTFEKRPQSLDDLSKKELDSLLEFVFNGLGYSVMPMGRVPEEVPDFILTAPDPSQKILLFSKIGLDTPDSLPLIDRLAAQTLQYEATKAWFVTTSQIQDILKGAVEGTHIEVYDRDDLLTLISDCLLRLESMPSEINWASEPEASNAVSLYFDTDEYSPKEIQSMLEQLSSLYQECGGDRLNIEHVDVLDPTSVFEPA